MFFPLQAATLMISALGKGRSQGPKSPRGEVGGEKR